MWLLRRRGQRPFRLSAATVNWPGRSACWTSAGGPRAPAAVHGRGGDRQDPAGRGDRGGGGGAGGGVAWARSSDRDIAPPYGLWRLALQDLPGRRGADKPGPDLWSLAFGGTAGPRLGSGSELDRGQRFALFSAVRERLARAAEPGGLLLVLDDIQWADEPSLLLLAYLVRQLRGVRMLILATCREPAPVTGPVTLLRLLSADANTERTALTGLPSARRGRAPGVGRAGRLGRAGAGGARGDGR